MAKSAAKKTSLRKKVQPRPALQIDREIWPLERDVLFRPDRSKYVRKLIHAKGCVFCAANKVEPRLETLCVHKTKHAMIVVNKYPYNSGHLLVLPRRHCGEVLGLNADEYQDVQNTILVALRAVTDVYEPAGFNMGLNQGRVAGAGIPEHLHYHLIPRWSGDVNFFPLIAETKVVIESAEDSYRRLKEYFQSL